jgi:hypothetical protein
MVEDRVTDGTRIAELLASELSGREDGNLADVSVVDADPEAEPDPTGTTAYRVAVRGEVVAAVAIYPDAAELSFVPAEEPNAAVPVDAGALDVAAVRERAREAGLDTDEDRTVVRVESGAAVKRAFDAVRAGLG